jgi:GDP-4-dehydro-6-deoxy-D-mannose reductase
MAEPPRVLLTGCGGFLAGALGRHLTSAWPQARVAGLGRHAMPGEGVTEVVQLDLNEGTRLGDALARLRPDIVFHAAGRVTGGDWAQLYRDNVQATLTLLDALSVHAPQARIVIAGSAAECGMVDAARLPVLEEHALRPVSPYGVSKAWQSLAARSYAFRGLHVVVGRVFNVVGRGVPEYTSVGAFAEQLRAIAAGRGDPVMRVGNLEPRRDFLDVTDVASALCALATSSIAGEVYNICSGRSIGIGEVLEQLIALSGLAVRVETEPARLRPGDVPDVYGSPAKISAACGWSPRVRLADSLSASLAS